MSAETLGSSCADFHTQFDERLLLNFDLDGTADVNYIHDVGDRTVKKLDMYDYISIRSEIV